MCVKCHLHNEPLGRHHLCDTELVKIKIPFVIEEIIQLNEIQAAILIEKVYVRLKEIGKFEYMRPNMIEEY